MSARVVELDLETGVYTRQAFEREVAFAVQVARRAAQPCSLLVVDVDDFQALRDVRGDLAADSCLEALAQRISAECSGAGAHRAAGVGHLRAPAPGVGARAGLRAGGPAPGGSAGRPLRDGDGQRGGGVAPSVRTVGQPARGGRGGLHPRQAGRPGPQRPPALTTVARG